MSTTTETLLTCPDCGQGNILPRGLAAHRKSGHCAKARDARAARQPVTLARLDAMPEPADCLPAVKPVALKDCTVTQLEVLHDRFGEMKALHDSMSGACGTMRGLVLTELKLKIGHGKFLPWVRARYDKSPRRAQEYMQSAAAFVADSKCADARAFEFLTQSAADTLAQIELCRLDLSHPLVAAVVKWSDGKSFDQLLLALGDAPAKDRGGNQGNGNGEKLTPAEKEAKFLGNCREDFTEAFTGLDSLVLNGRWKAPSITDGERDDAVACAEKIVKKMRAWLKLPQKLRSQPSLADADAAEPEGED